MPGTGTTSTIPAALAAVAARLGPDRWRQDAAARAVYARDASHLTLGRPLAVALPRDPDEAAAVVEACARSGVPVVCRGAGTGLSGGAVPDAGQVVLSLARLTGLGPVDPDAGRVVAQAGVLNEQVSRHAAPHGLHFAPDPSSQAAATVGGNVAENAGGPHCLRHGVTLQHLRRLDWIDAGGRRRTTGRGAPAERGLDLVSLLCGSEGTLGVVTAAELALTPDPESVATLLAVFDRLDDATGAVVRLLGAGLLPVAVEMVDRAMLEAVEAAFAFGFPTDCDAVMIAEFGGRPDETADDGAQAAALLRDAGAREVRLAADGDERARLWMCRKKAFGAVGRLAPSYVTMDVVVPLGRLPRLVRDIQDIKAEHGVEVATAFHAGDGNLHPGVHFDNRDPDAARRAHAASDAIIRRALALGGSCTGEHGVGIEKRHALPWQLDGEAARLMRGIKTLCDPDGVLNPGKALPGDGEDWAVPPPAPAATVFAWDDLTVSVPADADLAAVQREALARGLWIPVGGLVGGDGPGLGVLPDARTAVDLLRAGPLLVGGATWRDVLLEAWADDGAGRPFHAGAPVFKNVAGYDLVHLLAGAGGVLARLRGATFKLAPAPEALAWRAHRGDVAAAWPRLAALASARPGPGGPTVVADAGTGSLHLLVAGRARPWDLPAFLAAWEETASAAGLAPAGGDQATPGAADALLAAADLPDWARRHPRWTALAAADGGPWPPHAGLARWVLNVAPRLLWTPDPGPWPDGCHADAVWRDGRATGLPEPPAGVPRRLLGGLKRLFDPDGDLPCPAWLAAAREEGHGRP